MSGYQFNMDHHFRYVPYPVHFNQPIRRSSHNNWSNLEVLQSNKAPDSQSMYRMVKREFLKEMNIKQVRKPMRYFLNFLSNNHPKLVNRHKRSYRSPKIPVYTKKQQIFPNLEKYRQLETESQELLVTNKFIFEDNHETLKAAAELLEQEKEVAKVTISEIRKKTEALEKLKKLDEKFKWRAAKRPNGIIREKETDEYLALVCENEEFEMKTKSQEENLKSREYKIMSREKELQRQEEQCRVAEKELNKLDLDLRKERRRLSEDESKLKSDQSYFIDKRDQFKQKLEEMKKQHEESRSKLKAEEELIKIQFDLLKEKEKELNQRTGDLCNRQEILEQQEEEIQQRYYNSEKLSEVVSENEERIRTREGIIQLRREEINTESEMLVSQCRTIVMEQEMFLFQDKLLNNNTHEAMSILKDWSTPAIHTSYELSIGGATLYQEQGNALEQYRCLIRAAKLSHGPVRQKILNWIEKGAKLDVDRLKNGYITPKKYLHTDKEGDDLLKYIDDVIIPEFSYPQEPNTPEEIHKGYNQLIKIFTTCREYIPPTNLETLTLSDEIISFYNAKDSTHNPSFKQRPSCDDLPS